MTGEQGPVEQSPGDPPPLVMIEHLTRERDGLIGLVQDLIDRLSVTLGEDGIADYRRRFVDLITQPIAGGYR